MPPAVKGSAILDTVRYLTDTIGGAQLDSIVGSLDPSAQKLFRDPILASDWYSLDSYSALLETVIQVVDHGDTSRFIRGSEKVFERQLSGIYRMFIRLGSPEWIIKRTTAAHQTYFRDLGIELASYEDNKAIVRFLGFGKQHRVIGLAIIAFYNKALKLSGAKQVEAAFTVPIEHGGKYAELTLSWA